VSLPGESRVLSRTARPWFLANALVVWVAVVADAAVTVGDVYPTVGADAGDFDYHQADGPLGMLGNAVDFASYFTTWSLVAVAAVVTVLAFDPARDGPVLRVARLTSILMITVTFVATTIAYPVWFGAGGVLSGWLVPVHLLKHVAAPVLTLLVWAVVGPRGWISRSTACWSLLVPLGWIAWTLGRGAVVGAYPYPPINVVDLGYGGVLVNVAAVVAAGALLLVGLVALDAWLGRRQRARRPGVRRGDRGA
jgi:hypothetical protein